MIKNLTTGNPMKLILRFTLPTLCGMLFQQMYNLVDTMIVGKLLGARALAAVGATGSVSFLTIGFCTGVCAGFAIPVAQQMGAGRPDRMRRYVANAVILCAAVAAVMTAAACLLCGRILTAMSTPADIYRDSYRYIYIIFAGIPVTFLYNLPAGVIRSLGDSKTPVLFLALSSVLNVALDLALILFTSLGTAGAAVATVVSQGVSALACLAFIRLRFPILRMSREERKPDAALMRSLLAMGLPMGLQYSVTAVGSIILQSAVNGLGSLYVAAVAAGAKLFNLLSCPYDAMGTTMATYCGQNAGAGRFTRLGKGIRSCALMGLVYAALALLAMLLFAPALAMLFIDPQEQELELLQTLVARYVRLSAAFCFPLALVNIVRFSIQGMGFGAFAMLAGVLEMIARTAVGRFCVPAYGFTAACLASPCAWLCADLFLIPACMLCVSRLSMPRTRPLHRSKPRRRHLHGPRMRHAHA